MFLKLIIAYSILIWKADSQKYQSNNDFERFILSNIPQFNVDPYGGNVFSSRFSQNTDESYLNNGLGAQKRSDYQSNVRTQLPIQKNKLQSQQTVIQPNVQQQKKTQIQTNQKSVAIPLQLQQPQNLQSQNLQSQKPQNLQFQQTQNLQSQLQQQDTQTQLGIDQQQSNLQQQSNFFQQNQQQNIQQNIQSQYQQNIKPQQQSFLQNQQNQGQFNLQSQQNQQQNYLQNQQNQQQNYLQNQQNQQQFYPQNQQNYLQNQQTQQQLPVYQQSPDYGQNNQNYYSGQTNTQSKNTGLPSKFGTDNTGKTRQNANYNNETLALTKFALKLFKAAVSQENSVISPYSIALLLALVQQGSSGYTEQEITQALQLTPDASQTLFKGIKTFMKKRGSSNILKIASNVYVANGFTIDQKFKSNAINAFGSDVTSANFNDPYGTSARINSWVSDKTNRKIKNLLTPESITPASLMVLVNAVYFKGNWDIKFRPELTEDSIFTLSDGSQKLAKFMYATRMVRTDVDPALKAQIMILPFQGSEYSMMFILPLKGNNVNNVLLSLTEPQLYSYQNLGPKEVKIQIPKFTVKQDSDVQSVLSTLGLWTMFSNEAELQRIGQKNGMSPRISSGVHSALLSIDESGGSGGAATSLSVVALSYDDPSTSFTADRPFLAILWDNKLTTPLFMAKVEDPEP
ncbi:PREDICTED: serine protease inhibitor-like isoform X2 [Papilio xuthus]|uniref:Serine protease inhibitor-like isoform X1 n=1 Tax=Papilio xuthus TaxID=66420 RepID=A0AAJ7E7F8_PAPXU|nr:PREDICTED: serine protease inhibitor-like isoform X1 [Papilio xuthus]XP_013165962.1 PREDICTED: serine protease inhibitor-like isoform X2 [Papilio xuthus]